LKNPLSPKFIGPVALPPGLTYSHSFERLRNGHVIATMQAHDADFNGPGGLVEFDDEGRIIRSASAAAEGVDSALLRPYSLTLLPAKDRIVVTLSRMLLPGWDSRGDHFTQHEHQGFHIQLWRLSDLTLLKTIALEAPNDKLNQVPAEPRVLKDGTVLVTTMQSCGLYRVTGTEAASARSFSLPASTTS